jgi:hypothetical protein
MSDSYGLSGALTQIASNAFADRRVVAKRGHRRHDADGRNIIRWCFSDSATAVTFAVEFGGNLLSP